MRLFSLRGEEPPQDDVVVVRAGMNGLSPETVTRAAQRSVQSFGFLGISVWLVLDEPLEDLCAKLDEIRRYGQIRVSTVGRLRTAGFPLLATGQRPHFDIVLPDLAEVTLLRLETAFAEAQPNPGRR